MSRYIRLEIPRRLYDELWSIAARSRRYIDEQVLVYLQAILEANIEITQEYVFTEYASDTGLRIKLPRLMRARISRAARRDRRRIEDWVSKALQIGVWSDTFKKEKK